MMTHESYQSPLSSRYASPEMLKLFSSQFKYTTWRRLWLSLAEAEAELGLPITKEQLAEMAAHVNDIDFFKVAIYEKETNHDVMAHIKAFAEACPKAKSIIHLGATSCYVTDNTDLIQMRTGLEILLSKLTQVIRQLSTFSKKYAQFPCLGYTHFQPAQLTTIGKRGALWTQEFLIDLLELESRIENIRFLGVKGATGTQASFLALFKNDKEKVKKLDHLVAKKMGFSKLFIISGQTYTRKQDAMIFNTLSGIATSAHKFATDIRLLAGLKEMEEPFTENQVGSTAMPYKRNPILAERICALSRFLISLSENPLYTAATQWLERSLDDSANRRLSLSEGFLTCDAILDLMIQITKDLVIYPKMIEKRINEELPFLSLETILMECVKKGGDRQDLHERIRQHSQAAAAQIKLEGKGNDLLERIQNDSLIGLSVKEIQKLLNVSNFIGRATEQVDEFIDNEVIPQLKKYQPQARKEVL
jgi:adenylosuccinate lyase